MQEIKIATDFSRTPGGRHKKLGPASGEEFRGLLVRKLRENPREKFQIIFDGAEGYGSSFLEEAFGGLVRLGTLSKEDISERLVLKAYSSDYQTYVDEAKQYIHDAFLANKR
ncbi:hypothetical protein ACI01nite_24880 [Acetobacter cibinongensis]|uniref:DUF4325 domain-containing protein n=1 Tax=Acetobacter cibinongensis TaxID=146475 RepID=A0A0D6N6M4_9PROT|nr:STAS-like domain-containing protein [Acetobacter cibinongensis]GAN61619.1 hypothetical protein Abci_046_052 [Acetobacter cibinongensis]GBQ17561.1 hypothetical protein AA0482_1947 [Acetobacter cibinongensis NRIC 0482]GEL59886.1 hypothetical protein ACI01nite_24880 [Acetobacter cibinongensis]